MFLYHQKVSTSATAKVEYTTLWMNRLLTVFFFWDKNQSTPYLISQLTGEYKFAIEKLFIIVKMN